MNDLDILHEGLYRSNAWGGATAIYMLAKDLAEEVGIDRARARVEIAASYTKHGQATGGQMPESVDEALSFLDWIMSDAEARIRTDQHRARRSIG